jgi:DeoR/GlpR family transcriptional regulator of sugar metabolism/ABC-type sugar transport system substrate-binding protein
MSANERLERIVSLIEKRRFISVKELSNLCSVSEMTIRRDLQRLHEEQRVQRVYGGAVSLQLGAPPSSTYENQAQLSLQPEGFLVDRVDVLIASSVDPKYDSILLDRVEKRDIPIIAESLAIGREETVVSVDNYQAGMALGRWAGNYAQQHWDGQAFALDLSYRLSNTQARSQGFIAGLRDVLPAAQVILSINAQSQYETAYELTIDALTVHPNINVIFAINDTTAWGASQACRDLGLDPDSLLVVTFGLEGDTLKNALMIGEYCKAGLAMFPEIVGPVCVEAAIDAYNNKPLARQLIIPYAILTPETLPMFYAQSDNGWQIRWDTVKNELSIPLDIDKARRGAKDTCPGRIGFIVPFSEHEWYKNLILCMQAHAAPLKIELEIVDADRSLKGEMDLRRREIARIAAEQVQPGDVILIDSGQITTYLAEQLAQKQGITVITNSLPVFDILKDNSEITLISTGGLLRHSTDSLIGPTAEATLRELRADKLFLIVTGITLGFGLSHTNMAEIAMKQAMIRAAREVILLADHAIFGQESVAQVAPTTVVHKLVTDEALPASTRLELTKLGIGVIVARV